MAETPYSIDDLLEQMVARNASDLHVAVGAHPVVRVRGKLEPLQEIPPLTPDDTQQLLYRILSTEQQKHLEIEPPDRLRVLDPRPRPLPRQRLLPARVARRRLPSDPDRDQDARGARPPARLHELTDRPRGLVLVTGPTGSGKSTTLAALIDEINRNARGAHPHDRGPDRVRAPPQALHRQPARDRRRRDQLRRGAPRRAPPGPRRDPPRRDARPRDDRDRADRGRDRPPRLRHAAHAERARDDRPHHRRLPRRAAGARCACSSPPRSQGIVTQTLLPTADGTGPRRGARDPASRTTPSGT